MPIRLETDVETKVCEAAEKQGWAALKLVAIGRRGFPDRWFIKPGPRIVIIEFKRPGQYQVRVRKLQKFIGDWLTHLGFEVHLGINDYDTAAEILGLD